MPGSKSLDPGSRFLFVHRPADGMMSSGTTSYPSISRFLSRNYPSILYPYLKSLDMTCLKNNLGVSSSIILVVVRIMLAYLVSLSMITKMLLNPLETGNSGIKSILTTSKGCDGIGMGCNSPTSLWCLSLVF